MGRDATGNTSLHALGWLYHLKNHFGISKPAEVEELRFWRKKKNKNAVAMSQESTS